MAGDVRILVVRVGGRDVRQDVGRDVVPGGLLKRFEGRFAWTLLHLIEAGERGVTPIEWPAPRWSHYIYVLRREGLVIETIEERHGGPYAGRHGRYVLRTPVKIIERRNAA